MRVNLIWNTIDYHKHNYHLFQSSEVNDNPKNKGTPPINIDIDFQSASHREKYEEEKRLQNQIAEYQQAQQIFEKTSDIVHFLKDLIKNDKENRLPKFNELFKEVRNAIEEVSKKLEGGANPRIIAETVYNVIKKYTHGLQEGDKDSSINEETEIDTPPSNENENGNQNQPVEEGDTLPTDQDSTSESNPPQRDSTEENEGIDENSGDNTKNVDEDTGDIQHDDSKPINEDDDSYVHEDIPTENNGKDEKDEGKADNRDTNSNNKDESKYENNNESINDGKVIKDNTNRIDLEDLYEKIENEIAKPILDIQKQIMERQYEIMNKMLDNQRELIKYVRMKSIREMMLEMRVKLLETSNKFLVHQYNWEQRRNIIKLLM